MFLFHYFHFHDCNTVNIYNRLSTWINKTWKLNNQLNKNLHFSPLLCHSFLCYPMSCFRLFSVTQSLQRLMSDLYLICKNNLICKLSGKSILANKLIFYVGIVCSCKKVYPTIVLLITDVHLILLQCKCKMAILLFQHFSCNFRLKYYYC